MPPEANFDYYPSIRRKERPSCIPASPHSKCLGINSWQGVGRLVPHSTSIRQLISTELHPLVRSPYIQKGQTLIHDTVTMVIMVIHIINFTYSTPTTPQTPNRNQTIHRFRTRDSGPRITIPHHMSSTATGRTLNVQTEQHNDE